MKFFSFSTINQSRQTGIEMSKLTLL